MGSVTVAAASPSARYWSECARLSVKLRGRPAGWAHRGAGRRDRLDLGRRAQYPRPAAPRRRAGGAPCAPVLLAPWPAVLMASACRRPGRRPAATRLEDHAVLVVRPAEGVAPSAPAERARGGGTAFTPARSAGGRSRRRRRRPARRGGRRRRGRHEREDGGRPRWRRMEPAVEQQAVGAAAEGVDVLHGVRLAVDDDARAVHRRAGPSAASRERPWPPGWR